MAIPRVTTSNTALLNQINIGQIVGSKEFKTDSSKIHFIGKHRDAAIKHKSFVDNILRNFK